MSGVVLVGFMASGKSTIGRLLAQDLGTVSADTDLLFESRHACSAAHFIRRYGESTFREHEYEVLQEALQPSPVATVIATGGGIVTFPDSRTLLQTHAPVIWLRVQPGTVLERAKNDSVDRPLLQMACIDPLQHVQTLMDVRNPLYAECANAAIDVDGREPSKIVEWIKAQL